MTLENEYKEYKERYEKSCLEMNTYKTRVNDSCERINKLINELKTYASNCKEETRKMLEPINSLEACTEDNIMNNAKIIKKVYSDLEAYCRASLMS